MPVPISGSFKMFDLNYDDPQSIQGAISSHNGVDGLAITPTIYGIDDFQDLIAASVAAYFDPVYAGTIVNPITDVSASLQYRNYPLVLTPTPSVTPTRTPTPSVTPSISISPTRTPSVTPSVTPSISISPTRTPSVTPTISVSPSRTPSITPTISVSPSRTPTITPSPAFKRYYELRRISNDCTTIFLDYVYGYRWSNQTQPVLGEFVQYLSTCYEVIREVSSFSGTDIGEIGTLFVDCFACNRITRTPTPTPTRTPTITPSITPSISVSPSRTPSITPSISVSPSRTPSISVSPSITPSITPSISVSPSRTPSISPSPVSCTCYSFYYGGENFEATFFYTDCSGNPSSIGVPLGSTFYVCVRSGTSPTSDDPFFSIITNQFTSCTTDLDCSGGGGGFFG
jgi:hypothetical protein